ncbi:hypothetical protein TREES_T100020912 [Tupaia chinensis]|uniref:Uncharacterized protein n=1 Tax=Tupaia chinensis TaxID=246437 RepID=L9JEA2_TUPCH|nr:hypothetical protein TREES_T100020912 [Tupaia chinensis]
MPPAVLAGHEPTVPYPLRQMLGPADPPQGCYLEVVHEHSDRVLDIWIKMLGPADPPQGCYLEVVHEHSDRVLDIWIKRLQPLQNPQELPVLPRPCTRAMAESCSASSGPAAAKAARELELRSQVPDGQADASSDPASLSPLSSDGKVRGPQELPPGDASGRVCLALPGHF